MNELLASPEKTPDWMAKGTTYLLPKDGDTCNPQKYRPITCLTTTYKTLTSILTERMYAHMEENDLFPLEQKGCRKGSYGCKDQLLINRMILEICHSKHRNLSMAWIDYKKAFDSVPHPWLLRVLELFKISPKVVEFLRHNMKMWNTDISLSHSNGVLEAKNISVHRGIFQGDSLSPLLFCIALIPLSLELNRSHYGFKVGNRKINHLFYFDDVKLYGKDDSELEGLLKTIKSFSDDIGMEFGLEKCAKATFNRGKLVRTNSIELELETTIKELGQEQTYKYLGIDESDGIQHASMKDKVRKECVRRVRAMLRTELNAKNRIKAINTLAIPVITYSFNIVNWNMSEIRKIDRKIRKLLTCNGMHHPKADTDRLYLPRREGGRGLIQLELTYKTTTIGLHQYLEHSKDWMLKLVKEHENTKKLHSVTCESRQFARELEIVLDTGNEVQAKDAREIRRHAKQQGLEKIEAKWEEKPLHGQYATRRKHADVDQKYTNQWLWSSGLKAETEGLIMAAQDQSLQTRNFLANIIKNGTTKSAGSATCMSKPLITSYLVVPC